MQVPAALARSPCADQPALAAVSGLLLYSLLGNRPSVHNSSTPAAAAAAASCYGYCILCILVMLVTAFATCASGTMDVTTGTGKRLALFLPFTNCWLIHQPHEMSLLMLQYSRAVVA